MAIGEVIGSYAPFDYGRYTFVAADDTAGTKSIVTKIGTITAAIVTMRDATGVEVGSIAGGPLVTFSGDTLTVADGGTKKLTATDTIDYVVFGTPKA